MKAILLVITIFFSSFVNGQWNEVSIEKDIFNRNFIHTLSFQDKENIFGIGFNGSQTQSVWLSKDGGNNFDYIFNIGYKEWGRIQHIHLTENDTLILITAKGILKKSTDIFHTPEFLIKYENYNSSYPDQSAVFFYFKDGDSAIVAAKNIFKSFDGGKTWLNNPKGTSLAHGYSYTGTLISSTNTILHTNGVHLYESNNFANTWDTIFNFRPFFKEWYIYARDFSFVSSKIGYTVIGNDVYKTTDGGYHWDSISHFDTPSMGGQDVKFFNEKVGYATLSNSTKLYKTTDGGINWTSEFEFPSRFGNNKQLYYFGDSLFFILNDNKIFKRDKKQLSVEVTDSEPTAKVYPNPFNNIINIELSKHFDNTPIEYKVLDIQGKTIANGKRNDSSLNINLERLEKGIYFLQINNSNFFITKKILKN